MRTINLTASALALALLAGAAAPALAANAASFEAAYDAAEAARKKAASVGYEWRDTGKMLKQAKKAAEAGDFAKAEKLAEEAEYQGVAAYAQWQQQDTGWKDAVPK